MPEAEEREEIRRLRFLLDELNRLPGAISEKERTELTAKLAKLERKTAYVSS